MILGSGLLTASGITTLTLYTTKSGTFNPTIVASDTSGIVWTWPDGSTYTGGTPSKVLAGGTQTITIAFDDPALVTELNFYSQNMTGEWGLSTLAKFTALTHLRAYSNTALNISGEIGNLPPSTQYLHVASTSSTLSGDFADFPSGLTHYFAHISQCTVGGSLASLPATMTTLQLNSAPVAVFGGDTPVLATGMIFIRIDSTLSTDANIDNILARLYTDRASFTYATPALNVGGTNPNPTGIYADATPPITGLEYAYKLVVDPDAEGFNTWTITY